MILVLLHPTSGYFEIQFYFEIHSEIAKIHVSGINELAQNREPVALTVSLLAINQLETFSSSQFKISCDEIRTLELSANIINLRKLDES